MYDIAGLYKIAVVTRNVLASLFVMFTVLCADCLLFLLFLPAFVCLSVNSFTQKTMNGF